MEICGRVTRGYLTGKWTGTLLNGGKGALEEELVGKEQFLANSSHCMFEVAISLSLACYTRWSLPTSSQSLAGHHGPVSLQNTYSCRTLKPGISF